VGFAARLHDLRVTVVVPHGNSAAKNAAMRALGVDGRAIAADLSSGKLPLGFAFAPA
jgi:threonine dehydratase